MLALVATLILAILVLQNSASVSLRFLTWHVDMSLAVLVFITGIAGILVGLGLGGLLLSKRP
ncbi:MAG: DUF1049 domain-containing protein [Candidatus Eisenbacteria bacterium]|uniref:DUF1049 domain-containing protein n=1 Tax=Eiseniibacteriota bacterium TaxID=2212470 RepID=A0A7Y2E939_UNCEI|nr:DUF1049 domain-containing protein [Candidatus Eisenbacteria bacterium]